MRITVDLSLYPLAEAYEPPILDIIHRLEAHPDLEVRRNPLSTQVSGEYDRVMAILSSEMKRTFEAHKAVMVAKFVHAPPDGPVDPN